MTQQQVSKHFDRQRPRIQGNSEQQAWVCRWEHWTSSYAEKLCREVVDTPSIHSWTPPCSDAALSPTSQADNDFTDRNIHTNQH